jgi:SNF2 family DNA or RNA helicase
MPELLPLDVPVTLPPEVMKIYNQVEGDFLAAIGDGAIVAANAAAAGTKCRQIANGAVYTGEGNDRIVTHVHDAKLDALDGLLEELNGHPVLLLYEFRHDRERIMDRFPGVTDIKSCDIASIVSRFNSGDIRVLAGHPASMGHGLNLQGVCHHVIWFGIPWNLEYYDQAIARVYRQGQSHGIVYCYHLKALETKDVDVLEVLKQKSRTQEDLLNAVTCYRRDYLGQYG